jgi:hypothetical protein
MWFWEELASIASLWGEGCIEQGGCSSSKAHVLELLTAACVDDLEGQAVDDVFQSNTPDVTSDIENQNNCSPKDDVYDVPYYPRGNEFQSDLSVISEEQTQRTAPFRQVLRTY